MVVASNIREKMQSIGYMAAPGAPEECDRILRKEIESATQLVAAAGLRAM